MAFIGSTVSGGESLKGWAGTQVPALFFCAQQKSRRRLAIFRGFCACSAAWRRCAPVLSSCRCESRATDLDIGAAQMRPPFRRIGSAPNHAAVPSRRLHFLSPQGRKTVHASAAFTKSAARSPIMMLGALVLPLTRRGMIEASAIHSPSTPRALRVGSTTLAASLPMRQVPTG